MAHCIAYSVMFFLTAPEHRQCSAGCILLSFLPWHLSQYICLRPDWRQFQVSRGVSPILSPNHIYIRGYLHFIFPLLYLGILPACMPLRISPSPTANPSYQQPSLSTCQPLSSTPLPLSGLWLSSLVWELPPETTCSNYSLLSPLQPASQLSSQLDIQTNIYCIHGFLFSHVTALLKVLCWLTESST